jgi:hypothetical protein
LLPDALAACLQWLGNYRADNEGIMRTKDFMRDSDFKKLTDFLVELGIDKVGHTNKTYLAHLVSLYRLLESEGCSTELCRAGMFHSIYGTERFQGFKLDLARRSDVRTLIGERAERLAYLNCAMDRASFDRAVDGDAELYRFIDRITRAEVELSRRDFDDLCRVHLYDWLEQAARSQKWDYRRAAYRRMADRLGLPATAAYERVFALEKNSATV